MYSTTTAHGKRSGNVIGNLRTMENNVGIQDNRRMPPLDERWLLSRLVNRQLMQVPLAARMRAVRILDDDRFVDKIHSVHYTFFFLYLSYFWIGNENYLWCMSVNEVIKYYIIRFYERKRSN